MKLSRAPDRIGMALANLSILKTGKARAIGFSTLDAICEGSRASLATFSSLSRSKQNASGRHEQADAKPADERLNIHKTFSFVLCEFV
jgi:hypothetical protein